MHYSAKDAARVKSIEKSSNFEPEPYRTPYRRDCGRLIHSPAFRRLQGKTQLFPGRESDFFRNRLTHSLEVAQIAKSIALRLNYQLESTGEKYRIDTDIVEFASLAHDLGHPPFGHFGEEMLDEKIGNYGGFEGNAQTLRILSKTEKRELIYNTKLGIDSTGKDKRIGLDLTARSLASVLKYDQQIPFKKESRTDKSKPQKGYYRSERSVVTFLKNKICSGKKYKGKFKTIECQIMDIADDIAYSTYDLEDSFKAGFIRPIDLVAARRDVIVKVKEKVSKIPGIRLTESLIVERMRNLFTEISRPPVEFIKYPAQVTREMVKNLHLTSVDISNAISNQIANDGYARTRFTSRLVGSAIRNVSIKNINTRIPCLSKIELEKDKKIDVEILKNFVFESEILSPKIKIVEYRSKEIIRTIFDMLAEKKGYMLLPEDFKAIYEAVKGVANKRRVICDFIAGMTDQYALEFYGRLTSENPETIFKPF